MRADLHQRIACFETPAFARLLSMRNVGDPASSVLSHAGEARSAVAKPAVGLSGAGIAVAAAIAGSPALAWQAPDLAKYDCTRLEDGGTVRGEELIAEGYQIASQGRFGQPNVMLVEPKSARRANCFVRPEGQR